MRLNGKGDLPLGQGGVTGGGEKKIGELYCTSEKGIERSQ